MPIFTGCPGCWTTLRIPDRLAGKQVRCNQCGEVLKVPEAKISDDEPLPADADRDQTTKRCPACKREIVKEAATCYHCGQTIENS